MKKKIFGAAGLLILVAVIVVLASSLVVTKENEYSLIKQFGKVETVVTEPGLSLKIPFIQTVDKLPKEILLYDLATSDVITMDKKTMVADSFVLWRIAEPLEFAQSLNSSVTNAEGRINTIVFNSLKNVIGSMAQTDVISGRAGTLTKAMMDNIGSSLEAYGIQLISIETKQLDLPGDNKEAVYERMISERDKIAATYTAEGSSEAQIIKNTTDREIAISLSGAEADAEKIIANGEAQYMKILSDAYSDKGKSEFYSFVRSLDAAKASLKGDNKTLILNADSPMAQIFYAQ